MLKEILYVLPVGQKWGVAYTSGIARGLFATQRSAEEYARQAALSVRPSAVVLLGPGGRELSRETYDN
jgi:hypothetical protein